MAIQKMNRFIKVIFYIACAYSTLAIGRSARVKKLAAAHENFSAFNPLDLKQKRSGQSELKILVSVVRFRPGPPRNTKNTFRWFFIYGQYRFKRDSLISLKILL